MNGTGIVHALSFDVEDWFHVVEIPALEDRSTWPTQPSIVLRRVDQILGLLDRHGVRATFFVLGWVAQQHPGLVRRIAAQGHEIASHSFWHERVGVQGREKFEDDLKRSLAVLEDEAGMPIGGFRAPSFSIVPGCEWAFDVLLDHGIRYDASLFPARRAHGGYPCPRGPHVVTAPSGRRLPELPMSVVDLGPARLCYSGGGYLRLLPQWLIERSIASEEREGRPTVTYLHPRDFATDCPRVPMPLLRRFKCHVGSATTERKLEALLRGHRFDTCAAVMRPVMDSLA